MAKNPKLEWESLPDGVWVALAHEAGAVFQVLPHEGGYALVLLLQGDDGLVPEGFTEYPTVAKAKSEGHRMQGLLLDFLEGEDKLPNPKPKRRKKSKKKPGKRSRGTLGRAMRGT